MRLHGLRGRRFPGRIRGHVVRRRAGAQPGSSRRAVAKGLDVRGQPRAQRHGVPRVDRQLVPSGEPLRRSGRRALRHRLLPSLHRASGMVVQRPAEEPRRALHRPGSRPHLSHRLDGGAARATTSKPRLGSASDAELVADAGRIATSGGDARHSACSSPAIAAARSRRSSAWPTTRPTPLARLHALWTLEGLGRLDAAQVLQALADRDPGVRENAIVLAEKRLSDPKVSAALLALVGRSGRARALSAPRHARFARHARVARRAGAPAARGHRRRVDAGRGAERVLGSRGRLVRARAAARRPTLTASESPGRAQFFERLGGVIAAREKPAELARAIAAVTDPSAPPGDWWRAALLEGVARGIGGSRGDRRRLGDSQDTLLTLATGDQPRLRRAAVTLLDVSGIEQPAQAATAALARAARAARRRVGHAETRASTRSRCWRSRMRRRISVSSNRSIDQRRARRGADRRRQRARTDCPATPRRVFLLAKWPTLTTSVRSAAATVILSRREGAQAMLDALQSGAVKPWMLNFWHKRSLIMHRDERIRAVGAHHARGVAGRARAEPSPATPRRSAAAATRHAAPTSSRATARCAIRSMAKAAWRWGPIWRRCGIGRCRCCSPTSSSRAARSRSTTRRIRSRRAAGDTLVGVIGDQSPTAITFRQGPGQSVTVRRGDIRQMSVSPQSTMPEALDEQITPDGDGGSAGVSDAGSPLGRRCCSAAAAQAATGRCPAARDALRSIAAALLDERHDQKAREALAREAAPRARRDRRRRSSPGCRTTRARSIGGSRGSGASPSRRVARRTKPRCARCSMRRCRAPRQPLRDWQAVVLGGGVVMGLSQAGAWPRDVMTPWLPQMRRARRDGRARSISRW